jgi:hypothetical protein
MRKCWKCKFFNLATGTNDDRLADLKGAEARGLEKFSSLHRGQIRRPPAIGRGKIVVRETPHGRWGTVFIGDRISEFLGHDSLEKFKGSEAVAGHKNFRAGIVK